jgi:hypothetical protein
MQHKPSTKRTKRPDRFEVIDPIIGSFDKDNFLDVRFSLRDTREGSIRRHFLALLKAAPFLAFAELRQIRTLQLLEDPQKDVLASSCSATTFSEEDCRSIIRQVTDHLLQILGFLSMGVPSLHYALFERRAGTLLRIARDKRGRSCKSDSEKVDIVWNVVYASKKDTPRPPLTKKKASNEKVLNDE